MEEQRELVFHDTVPLPEEQLGEAREVAKKQKERVLNFFSRYPDQSWTPSEVYYIMLGENVLVRVVPRILLTSVRRSITDLTKENRLIKCQWSEGRQGAYGKYNRTWRYNTEYIKPLNPKK